MKNLQDQKKVSQHRPNGASKTQRGGQQREQSDVQDKVLVAVGVCCRVGRDSLDGPVPVAFVGEVGGKAKLGVLSEFLIELVVKLPLRRDVVFEAQVARVDERTVDTSPVVFSRSLDESDFGIRDITHFLHDGADCIEGP